MYKKIKLFFSKPFFTQKKYIVSIWFLLAIISSIKQFLSHNPDKYNNYLIYKNVFWHLINKQNLYLEYPNLYFDHNHYGPLFGLIIAPFALMPDWLGMTLWSVFNAGFLVWAINKLPLKYNQINLIYWICAHEFLTTILSFQFNPIMAAIIILSYVFVIQHKEIWATCLIVVGTLVKLYGIVGLSFFFFSKQKIKYILYGLFWLTLFILLPMIISEPEFVIQTYLDWFNRLVVKNAENVSLSSMQDISFMGMFRRIFQNPNLPNTPFLAIGITLFSIPYFINIKYYFDKQYQLLLLASVLIFTVIFSSGSESPTYIIAFVGIAIWFVIQKEKSPLVLFLFIFAMLLTSFSPSDIIPKYLRENYVKPYALKALPCVLIWFKITYEMIFYGKELSTKKQ